LQRAASPNTSGPLPRPANQGQARLDISADQLAIARDAGRGNYPNPWDFPPHWVRLVMRIMAEDQELQDFFYERWSNDMHRITALLEQRKRLEE